MWIRGWWNTILLKSMLSSTHHCQSIMKLFFMALVLYTCIYMQWRRLCFHRVTMCIALNSAMKIATSIRDNFHESSWFQFKVAYREITLIMWQSSIYYSDSKSVNICLQTLPFPMTNIHHSLTIKGTLSWHCLSMRDPAPLFPKTHLELFLRGWELKLHQYSHVADLMYPYTSYSKVFAVFLHNMCQHC